MAVLAATTLLPATICLLGDRLDRFSLRPAAKAASRGTLWRSIARLVTRHPIRSALLSLVLLLTLAAPSVYIRSNLHEVSELPRNDPVARELTHISTLFGAGAIGPLEVVTRRPQEVLAVLARDNNVRRSSLATAGRKNWYALDALLKVAPESNAAYATVSRLRRELQRGASSTSGLRRRGTPGGYHLYRWAHGGKAGPDRPRYITHSGCCRDRDTGGAGRADGRTAFGLDTHKGGAL